MVVEKEAEARSGRLIDQKYPARVLDPRREAVFLFCAVISQSARCVDPALRQSLGQGPTSKGRG